MYSGLFVNQLQWFASAKHFNDNFPLINFLINLRFLMAKPKFNFLMAVSMLNFLKAVSIFNFLMAVSMLRFCK